MNLHLIAVYRALGGYLAGLEAGGDADELWEKYAVAPYWQSLCRYAPMDLSARKPKPVKDPAVLRRQLALLDALDPDALGAEFGRAASALPSEDDDPLDVALYPLDDGEKVVKEKQNGVIGDGLFGSIMIRINPLADGYADWLPYVFAHEYHHTVWGNYWYVLHGGALESHFLNALVIDGEADCFARSLYPSLKPAWLYGIKPEEERSLWHDHYAPLLFKPEREVDYEKYMFGGPARGIPWCAGYALGYRIVRRFLDGHPDVSFPILLSMEPTEILRESGYDPEPL